VLVGVDAKAFPFQFYHNGVISNGFLCGDRLDHAVTAVGYTQYQGKDAFIIKNSWGPDFGQNGYLYISTKEKANRGNGVCGVLSGPVFPTA
jgi:C1A family cysteine protease